MGYAKDAVSVIVPVYNAEKFLEETLDSLAAQTYGNIEILLIDDGSRDSSRSICETYANRDQRFRYYYQENAGAGAARNHGIDLARGEFLMFLDSDDLFEPNLVERLHDVITAAEADVATCRADEFNTVYAAGEGRLLHENALIDGGVYKPSDLAGRFYQVLTTCPWDKMFRSEPITNQGLRFQNLRYSNDTFFVFTAMLSASRIAVTEDVLVHYRYGLGGSLRDKMYLNPNCDLDMLDALHDSVSRLDMAGNDDLLRSLDLFTADIVIYSCLHLAAQSKTACRDFLVRLKSTKTPGLKRLMGLPINYETAKRAYKYWAVNSIPVEGLVWAVRPLGDNGWRGADKSQAHAVYLRFLFARFIAYWERIKGKAVR